MLSKRKQVRVIKLSPVHIACHPGEIKLGCLCLGATTIHLIYNDLDPDISLLRAD